MTQLEAAKKTVRRQLRHYKQHAHNSKWRQIIDDTLLAYSAAYPGKALILKEIFMSGRARRHRPGYEAIAQQLYVSPSTVNVWIDEIVQEIMLQAAKERIL